MRCTVLALMLITFMPRLSYAQLTPPDTIRDNIVNTYPILSGKFQSYDVILEPGKDAAEWWAGAPSVLRDDKGTFWLAARMRTPEAPRGLRGYEIQIHRSKDGINFKKVHTIHREDVPIPGFERPVILQDPATKKYKLYACGPWKSGDWSIIKFDDANSPEKFIASSARPVIQPLPKTYERDIRPDGYKDPTIIFAQGAWHCYVIGTMRRTERIYHFTSPDGETWKPVGTHYESIMDLEGWHDFYTRPASIVPLPIGYLFFYEGSGVSWNDPVYNMGTGVAFTFDLHTIQELTTQAPFAISSTPTERFHTFRYSHWMFVDNELWCYAEVTRPNESHEIRLFRLK